MKALLSGLRHRHVVPLAVVLALLAGWVWAAAPAGAIAPATSAPGASALPPSWVARNPIAVLGPVVRSALSPDALSPPFTPAQIRKAYGIDGLSQTGAGKTIAVIIAFRSDTIQSDLNTFCYAIRVAAIDSDHRPTGRGPAG